jgi:hypothetical protein
MGPGARQSGRLAWLPSECSFQVPAGGFLWTGGFETRHEGFREASPVPRIFPGPSEHSRIHPGPPKGGQRYSGRAGNSFSLEHAEHRPSRHCGLLGPAVLTARTFVQQHPAAVIDFIDVNHLGSTDRTRRHTRCSGCALCMTTGYAHAHLFPFTFAFSVLPFFRPLFYSLPFYSLPYLFTSSPLRLSDLSFLSLLDPSQFHSFIRSLPVSRSPICASTGWVRPPSPASLPMRSRRPPGGTAGPEGGSFPLRR